MELTFSLDNINKAAAEFLDHIRPGSVIALHGDMGAGKTTFIHAVCEVLGVVDNVSSPTFAIIHEYNTATGKLIYHLDLYRVKDEEEAVQAGVEDCFYKGDYSFTEWPEKAPHLFPPETIHVYLETISPDTRKLKGILP